ncbi:hypothetical protein BCR44DRAFT_1442226, partial [Catenaria anguillulae PL171]
TDVTTSLQLLVSQYTTQMQSYLGEFALDKVTAAALLDGLSLIPSQAKTYGFNLGPIFFSWVAALHAAKVCTNLFNNMHPETSLLHTWVAVMVLSFGGTTMASMLLARTPSWLAQDDLLAVHTAVYLLFRFTPAVHVANFAGLPFKIVCAIGDGIRRSLAITAFAVDTIQVRSAPPLSNSIVACLICGTLSGCGGGILNAVFGITQRSWTLGTPKVSLDVQLAAVVAVAYTFAMRYDVIDRATAQGMACAFTVVALIVQVLVTDLRTRWARSGKGKMVGNVKLASNKPLPAAPASSKAGGSPVPSPGRTPRKSASGL